MLVNEAIQTAMNFAFQIITNPPPTDLRLEEVEKHGDDWLVTVSYIRPGQTGLEIAQTVGTGGFKRDYRVIRVDQAGTFLSLKNRYDESHSVS